MKVKKEAVITYILELTPEEVLALTRVIDPKRNYNLNSFEEELYHDLHRQLVRLQDS